MDDDVFDLNPRQEKFAVEYARTGNAYKAALAAGYGAGTARGSAYRFLENPDISARVRLEQAAMLAEQRARLSAMANAALDALAATLDEAQPGSMARVRACELILDRAGHKPVETVEADVTTHDLDGMTEEQAIRVIEAARARLGLGVFVVPTPAPSIEAWAADHQPKES